ncbi:MAG: MFS transporter [Eubacteriales bacterium]|nr:MFS transporter [Eubacteriales bacterium]
MPFTKHAANKKKFPMGRFLAWKTSDISAAGLNIIVTTYLTIYCTNYLGVSGTLVGTILLISNLIDAVTDLVAGFIIDNTHSKWGKGRPYEIGIVGMWICTVLMFATPAQASQSVKVLWIFFMYTFIFGVFNTLRGAGSTAYLIRAFDNDRELVGKVGSYGGIVTTLGSMVVSLTFPVAMGAIATSAAGWTKLVALYALPLCVLGIGRFVFVKENPQIDADARHEKVTLGDVIQVFTRNKYVWCYAGMTILFNVIQNMTVQTYYFTYIVGNTDILGILSIMGILLLPLMLLMPLILKKFTVSQVIMGGAVLAMAGYGVNFFAGGNMSMLCAASVLTACVNLPVSYLCAVLLMDLFNYNEYKGLARLEGTTNQLAHGVSVQIGQGIGGFLLGILLDLGGFVATQSGTAAAQPQSAITMIRCLYSLVPMALLAGLIVCVCLLGRLDKEMPVIERTLAERHAQSKQEAR